MTTNASLELRDFLCSLALLYITGTSRVSQHLLTTTIHLQLEISCAKEKMEGSYHVRSNSMPSSSHPVTLSFEEHLNGLKTSEEASSPVCHKLSGLKDLYDSVANLLQLPLTQQSFNQERSSGSVEEVLDGSLRLLDVCDTTRDVFSQTREYVKELESSLRRRKGGDSSLANEVRAYMISKKKLNKVIEKSLRNLKLEKKCTTVNATGLIKTLREVEEISLAVFKSLLSLIASPKARLTSVFSKLMRSKRVTCEGADASEVEKIDAELLFLTSAKTINYLAVQDILNGLEALESGIREVEEELDCVYRRLMKTRVSLLNILNL